MHLSFPFPFKSLVRLLTTASLQLAYTSIETCHSKIIISAVKGSHSNSKLYQESYATRRPDVTPFFQHCHQQTASEWSSSATESSKGPLVFQNSTSHLQIHGTKGMINNMLFLFLFICVHLIQVRAYCPLDIEHVIIIVHNTKQYKFSSGPKLTEIYSYHNTVLKYTACEYT